MLKCIMEYSLSNAVSSLLIRLVEELSSVFLQATTYVEEMY
jgi:hypothetical protein